MESFHTVRLLAREWHEKVRKDINGIASASALLDAASSMTGIECQPLEPNDPLLRGALAVLDPDVSSIYYTNSATPEVAAFYKAHEFGHRFLDSAAGVCNGDDVSDAAPEDPSAFGLHRVEGYSPRERRECQANVFAREFLLPSGEARRLFIDERMTAEAIADLYGLTLNLVYQQLAYGLLIPDAMPTVEAASPHISLDTSQQIAAETEVGPAIVEAGPGTGKTRTLISRISWLHERAVDPASILVLTFSNKAAAELRERVALATPSTASAIWAGTFHSFGLEILRKFGDRIGLPTNIKVADPSKALLLLESVLPSLPLCHYLNLHEPLNALFDIQKAISRAKDELVTPARYLELGERMLAEATDGSTREAAEKAIEVALVYEIYEKILERKRIVDFADLIVKAVMVLRNNPDAQGEISNRYRHILVDEYQDVNRASGILLKLISGDSKNLWVVGDMRQSIYRFRGASPQNICVFQQDFPGAKRFILETNYRSQAPIVRLVEGFTATMRTSNAEQPIQWNAHRVDQDGCVNMEIATDRRAEAAGIARMILQHREGGIAYRDQAVLCRSHNNLARYAELLEGEGIPILYLGNLFERPEIRDLLSLISLTCEPTRGGLLRVAQFPEYDIPLEDVRSVLKYAVEQNVTPLDALNHLELVDSLTSNGKQRLESLWHHLDKFDRTTSPATFLSKYLFSSSRYLDTNFATETVVGQQSRLAIFQLLQFAFEYRATDEGDPKHGFLEWIRRLEILGDAKQLRQPPTAATGIDAVRLLTIHASKGLEYRAVYLPALASKMFPVATKSNPCPPPQGMLDDDGIHLQKDEEECLFFVALSRARDFICLSRAERYGGGSSPSSLLENLTPYLPHAPKASPTWRSVESDSDEVSALLNFVPERSIFPVEDLDQYLRCPRTYLYQRVLGLSGARKDNAYVQFHRCVYKVLRLMKSKLSRTDIELSEILGKLDEVWLEIGPIGHPYEPIYRQTAATLLERIFSKHLSVVTEETVWEIKRPGGTIRLRPDIIEEKSDEVVIRRVRTGRAPKKVDDDIYALYHFGAKQTYGTKSLKVEAWFLTSDEIIPAGMSDKVIGNRLQKYDDAIAAIRAGSFPPKENDRNCPRCPQYFICPRLPSSVNNG
jgi:DNA helicase II / ATP-dependent DNA helicase PcrA